MSWQAAVFAILGLVLLGGFVWFERSRPPARIIAAVAALAALGVAGRLALAPIPNVVATTDVALLAGYTLGTGPGFAVGALSGLVSNFWLGQGPWTPWQMAGWGMVGIGGAALAALSGRRLNRWGLAGVAALAGFAYGALLDLSVMVSFGGEQSFDRYLALSARGIPFNVAHAAGNAALMLAAGPAMVRMLDRYRERFEVTWSDAPLARTVAAIAIALFLALPLVVPPKGTAATGQQGAMAWLERQQNDDGGFGTSAADDSSVGMTGWAMLGMEAAGTNPADVASGKRTAIAYLRANASSISSTADLERSILALEGAGVNSRAFTDRDLVAELRHRQSSDGSYEHQVNLTAFAILAQRSAGVSGSNIGKPAAWLREVQNRNGGWASVDGGESEPDSTGSVLQALAVSPGGGDQLTAGSHWLAHSQHHDGGWSLTGGATTNAQSTAWAIQGIIAADRNPANIRTDGHSGLSFLAARQSSDGHYSYSKTSDQTPIWVTAQALTGRAREAFPIAAVARALKGDGGGGGGGSGGGGSAASDGSGGGGATTSPGAPPESPDLSSPQDAFGGGGAAPSGSGAKSSAKKGGGKKPAAGGGGGSPRASGLSVDDVLRDDGPAGGAGQSTTVEPVAVTSDPGGSSAPSTPVLLGLLGVLAVGLGLGFLWYRRTLP